MNPSACSRALATLIVLGAPVACSNGPTGPSSQPSPRLEMSGPSTIAPGEIAEYRLYALSSGGSRQEVSSQGQWTSSADTVLAVSSPGRAAARSAGEAVITAAYRGHQATIAVFVVPPGTFVVKGVVRDRLTNGAVADARVQALDRDTILVETSSDPDGSYRLYGVPGNAELRAHKDGLADARQTLNITAHSTLDLLIGHDLAGTYTLSLEIGGECAIAEFAKKRTYTATVTPAGRRFLVTLTDAVFATPCGSNSLAPGLGCNQFMIEGTDSGFRLSMIELDWGDGAHIQERLQDGSWLYVAGWGSGRTEGSALEVVATADTFHCRGSSPTLTESCRAGGTYCRTDDLRLRFVPK